MTKPDGTGDENAEWQQPSEDEIRRRAYEIFLERQCQCGGALDDWLEAEADLFMQKLRKEDV